MAVGDIVGPALVGKRCQLVERQRIGWVCLHRELELSLRGLVLVQAQVAEACIREGPRRSAVVGVAHNRGEALQTGPLFARGTQEPAIRIVDLRIARRQGACLSKFCRAATLSSRYM